MSQSAYNPALDQGVATRLSGVGSFGDVVFQVSEEQLSLVRGVSRKTAARVEAHQVLLRLQESGGIGQDFLVLSELHAVEDFKGMRYEKP